MLPPSSVPLPDIQSSADTRGVAINRVGVTNVNYPIEFMSGSTLDGAVQSTVASLDMLVALPAESRGTHMSRFLQVLRDWGSPLSVHSLPKLTDRLCTILESSEAELRLRFPYFVDRSAPVTGETGKVRLDVAIEVVSGARNDLTMTVKGPAKSLCPCSKEISARGAHNQRCELTVSVRMKPGSDLSIDELFRSMEQAASTPIFPVLKRPDEKWITENAYDHPKFVEDIVRDLALILAGDERLGWYQCSSTNFESIHQHNAYAQVEMAGKA